MARRPRRLRHEPRRPLSGHFSRDGRAKMGYPTEAQAKQAAQVSWVINNVDLQSYQCDFCHQWHNGRSARDE